MGHDKFGVFVSIPLNYDPEKDRELIAEIIEEYKFNEVEVDEVIEGIVLLQHPKLDDNQQPIVQGPTLVNQIINELCHQKSWEMKPEFSPYIRDLDSFIININNGFWASYNGRTHFIDRDIMLFGEPVDWTLVKGIKQFSGVECGCFMSLHGERFPFINTELRQNNSPTVGDFISFMVEYEDFKANGYARAPGEYHEIVIEGLEYTYDEDEEVKPDLVEALEKWCFLTRETYWEKPESFIADEKRIRCWWD